MYRVWFDFRIEKEMTFFKEFLRCARSFIKTSLSKKGDDYIENADVVIEELALV